MASKKGKASWTSIWSAYRYRARKKGFDWFLTREEFDSLIHRDCYYCGRSPELANGNTVTVAGVIFHYSGVDRISNNPRYSLQECVPCCAICNTAKGVLTEEEYLEHVRKVYDFRLGKR